MTRLLFDTTFLIDTERLESKLDEVVADADDDDIAIAAITVAQLRGGALLTDETHRARREAFLTDILAVIPVIDYDVEVAHAHAALLVQVGEQALLAAPTT